MHGDLAPDLTVLLDAPPAVGLSRARARGATDRFEVEQLNFFERVRQTYLERAARQPARFAVIDAGADLTSVHDAIRAELVARFP